MTALSYLTPVLFPPGCQVELFPCERKTLETVKELQGNYMCWKGSRGYSTYTSLCPYYRQVNNADVLVVFLTSRQKFLIIFFNFPVN